MLDPCPAEPDCTFTGMRAGHLSPGSDGLVALPQFPFPVAASRRERGAAERIAQRARNAYEFLGDALGVTPQLTLRVLGRADWHEHADAPIYGVTHVTQGGHLVVGAEPADAWRSVSRHLSRHLTSRALARLIDVHGADAAVPGGPSLDRLAETLIAHELAHVMAEQAGVAFPRAWLREAFANYALVAVLGETDPAGLLLVGSLAEAAATLDDGMPTLAQFEARFGRMDVVQSVLAELAITRGAYAAYASAGTAPLARLFAVFRGGSPRRGVECALAGMLASRVHPAIAAIPALFSPSPRMGIAA
jgi:hypothetical protein